MLSSVVAAKSVDHIILGMTMTARHRQRGLFQNSHTDRSRLGIILETQFLDQSYLYVFLSKCFRRLGYLLIHDFASCIIVLASKLLVVDLHDSG